MVKIVNFVFFKEFCVFLKKLYLKRKKMIFWFYLIIILLIRLVYWISLCIIVLNWRCIWFLKFYLFKGVDR